MGMVKEEHSMTYQKSYWEQESDVLNCEYLIWCPEINFMWCLGTCIKQTIIIFRRRASWQRYDHFMISWIRNFYKYSKWKKSFVSTNQWFHVTVSIQSNNISKQNLSNLGIRYGASIPLKDIFCNAILIPTIQPSEVTWGICSKWSCCNTATITLELHIW